VEKQPAERTGRSGEVGMPIKIKGGQGGEGEREVSLNLEDRDSPP